MLHTSYENHDGQVMNDTWVNFNSTAQVQQNFTILPDALVNQAYPNFQHSKERVLPRRVSELVSDFVWDDFSDEIENLPVELSLSLNSTKDCWEFIGRYFYMFFWLPVADLGQTVRTPMNSTTYDFSEPENIFVNRKLYQNHLQFVLDPYMDPERRKLNLTLERVFNDFGPLQDVETRVPSKLFLPKNGK